MDEIWRVVDEFLRALDELRKSRGRVVDERWTGSLQTLFFYDFKLFKIWLMLQVEMYLFQNRIFMHGSYFMWLKIVTNTKE
jgi:hypothetical protein